MGLLSTFYAGSVEDMAAAIRDRPASADQEFPSVHASSLFLPGIDDACRELSRLRGNPVEGLKAYVAEVLTGGDESELVRLTPAFVNAFSQLTDAEAGAVAQSLVERDTRENREFRARILARASKPIQSRLDFVALILAPVFAWHFAGKIGASMHAAVLAGVTVGIVFAAISFFVLPAVRRRRILSEWAPLDNGSDYRSELMSIAELCRRAQREGLDVLYDWSL